MNRQIKYTHKPHLTCHTGCPCLQSRLYCPAPLLSGVPGDVRRTPVPWLQSHPSPTPNLNTEISWQLTHSFNHVEVVVRITRINGAESWTFLPWLMWLTDWIHSRLQVCFYFLWHRHQDQWLIMSTTKWNAFTTALPCQTTHLLDGCDGQSSMLLPGCGHHQRLCHSTQSCQQESDEGNMQDHINHTEI